MISVVALLDVADTLGDMRHRTAHRRAISTAYYAVFHALAYLCADELAGGDARGSAAWHRIYRSLDHGGARDALKAAEFKPNAAVQDIARAFGELQDQRTRADYDCSLYPRDHTEASALIALARSTVATIAALSAEDGKLLAAHMIVKPRKLPRSQTS